MVIADTGFFLALADLDDPLHPAATTASRQLREPLITTWPVVTETVYLYLRRLGMAQLIRFVESYAARAFEVFDLTPDHAPRLRALIGDYADLPMDLADASLVVLAEHLGHGRILSTDLRDFRTYRWKNRHPFENLLATV